MMMRYLHHYSKIRINYSTSKYKCTYCVEVTCFVLLQDEDDVDAGSEESEEEVDAGEDAEEKKEEKVAYKKEKIHKTNIYTRTK